MQAEFLSPEEAWRAEIGYASVRIKSRNPAEPNPSRYVLCFWDPLEESKYRLFHLILSSQEFEQLRAVIDKCLAAQESIKNSRSG